MTPNAPEFSIKLAKTSEEIVAAQKLRYRVFVEELGARVDPECSQTGIEADEFDEYFDHLILQDRSLPQGDDVVGVYRLLRNDVAAKGLGFYSAGEFQLDKIVKCGRKSVELGRSCVDKRYRNGAAMHFLWKGLADYVAAHDIELLFGVASFHGTDRQAIAQALSYLHHNHLAPDDLRVAAQGSNAVELDILPTSKIDRRAALMQIPPLIKSYLRLGGTIGSGAYIDQAFNTIDVCLIMDTARMSQKYKDFYERDTAA